MIFSSTNLTYKYLYILLQCFIYFDRLWLFNTQIHAEDIKSDVKYILLMPGGKGMITLGIDRAIRETCVLNE